MLSAFVHLLFNWWQSKFWRFYLGRHCCTCIFYNNSFCEPFLTHAVQLGVELGPIVIFLHHVLVKNKYCLAFFGHINLNHFKIRTFLRILEKLCCVCIPLVYHSAWTNKYVHFGLKGTVAQLKKSFVALRYRSGTVNSNTVNSKFHLIRSFFEIFATFLLFHV